MATASYGALQSRRHCDRSFNRNAINAILTRDPPTRKGRRPTESAESKRKNPRIDPTVAAASLLSLKALRYGRHSTPISEKKTSTHKEKGKNRHIPGITR